MIIVKIQGGLGNQLFQYATARALGLRNGVETKMDISSSLIRDDHQRIYNLQHFNIRMPVAGDEEIRELLSRKKWLQKRSKYIQNKLGIALHPTWWHQTYVYQQQYHKALMRPVRRDIYLSGYWQNEIFFKDFRSLLLEELSVKYQPDAVNQSFLDKIKTVNAVSLHVRRGDALIPAALKLYKLPSIDYYKKAIRHITEKVKDPYFFVFSDDINWCRENIKPGFPLEFIDHNGDDKNYEDIRLMNHCRHHITANSTFSWWGAWLNPSDDKIVITPDQWYHPRKFNTEATIPANWIRIKD